MLLLALASVAAAAQPVDTAPRAPAAVQSRASVRILSGERIRFGEQDEDGDRDAPRRRETLFVIDGKPVAASFVEFE